MVKIEERKVQRYMFYDISTFDFVNFVNKLQIGVLHSNRVLECHRYDENIRVKNWRVGVKSLVERAILQNQAFSLEGLA